MIVVVATLKSAEGKGDALEQEFRKLVPKVLKDPGAIAYTVHRAIDDPAKFLVYEKYESRDALRVHGSTPHFKAFSQATATMVAGRAEVALYNEIV
jgi:quinol monooxygenase YgiN